MEFRLPPVIYNDNGSLRTVGFELEFSNLGIEESVQIIQDLYGGKVEKVNRFYHKVTGTRLGDFTVEFDLALLTEKKYKVVFDKLNIQISDIKFGSTTVENEIETVLGNIVGKIFPYEIGCPPIPLNQLFELEKLRVALYGHHAEGTKDFITNAFGTHINVEAPSTESESLLQYLRAFIILYPWLLEVGNTDFARKVSPFIDPFPDDYATLILDSGYKPGLKTFIEDYHKFNPDRNRPLDMYPLFAALNEHEIQKFPGLGKVKARKTFHYRLPNSCISDPAWTLAFEWNNWVHVEELAHRPEKIEQMSKEYLSLKEDTFIGFDSKWGTVVPKWLNY